jgi:glucosamine-6-phosphate deaminase
LWPGDWREIGRDSGRAIAIRPAAQSAYLSWIKHAILDGYSRRIAKAGGIDLQVIGVGGRGHVAFHEAGIPFSAGKMLLVRLDENTVRNAVADGHFATMNDSPRFAVSMGASLVFAARTVLLLASGARKREPVLASLMEQPSTRTPISYGQTYAARGGCLVYVVDAVVGEPLLERRRDLAARGVEIVDRRRGRAKRRVEDIRFYRDLESGCYRCG